MRRLKTSARSTWRFQSLTSSGPLSLLVLFLVAGCSLLGSSADHQTSSPSQSVSEALPEPNFSLTDHQFSDTISLMPKDVPSPVDQNNFVTFFNDVSASLDSSFVHHRTGQYTMTYAKKDRSATATYNDIQPGDDFNIYLRTRLKDLSDGDPRVITMQPVQWPSAEEALFVRFVYTYNHSTKGPSLMRLDILYMRTRTMAGSFEITTLDAPLSDVFDMVGTARLGEPSPFNTSLKTP